MTTFDRITSDPALLNGQPCIRGLRLTVRRVLEALAAYSLSENRRGLSRICASLKKTRLGAKWDCPLLPDGSRIGSYPNRNQLRAEYPELEDEHLRQALEHSAANHDDRIVEPRPTA